MLKKQCTSIISTEKISIKKFFISAKKFLNKKILQKKIFMKKNGYSLFEIYCVLLLLGLLAYFAMPKIFDISNRLMLYDEANQLASELKYLREMTMNYQDYRQEFDSVEATSRPELHNRATSYVLVQGGKIIASHDLPQGMRLFHRTQTRTVFYFEKDGDAKPSFTLQLQKNLQNIYVIVDEVGRIRISHEPP